MDVSELLGSLESLFVSKKMRVQRLSEVSSFARMDDLNLTFREGFLFWGSNHVHRPMIFMGVYTSRTVAWIHLTFQVKLRIPDSLRGDADSFFNAHNLSHKCLWGNAGSHTRFYCSFPIPKRDITPYLRLIITSSDKWFKEAIESLVNSMKKDREFAQSVEGFYSEMRLLEKWMPKGTVTEAGHKDIGEIALRQLKGMRAEKISGFEKVGRTVISFSMAVEGAISDPHSQSFCAILTIGPALFELKLFYGQGSKLYNFSDPQINGKTYNLMTFVNEKLTVGYFSVESEIQFVCWVAKGTHCLWEKKEAGKGLEGMLKVGIEAFQTYTPRFADILRSDPQKVIFSRCMPKVAAVRTDIVGDAEGSKSNDLSDASQACSVTESDSDEEGDAEPIYEEKCLKTPTKSFDFSNSEDFRQRIPAKLLPFFCLDSDVLTKAELVYWIYDNRIENSKCIKTVVEKFLQLKRLGVVFSRLPLEAVMLDRIGEPMIVPTFSVDTIEITHSPRDETNEEMKVTKLNISCEILTFLTQNVSKEKFITLANFKIFRALQDIDFIAKEKFVNQNIYTFEVVGKGGFGEVYRNKMGDIDVALKSINKERSSTKRSSRDRLKSEFHLMQSCTHPNVVRAFGYTKFDKRIMLVLEYCGKGGLNKYLQLNNPSLRERVRILMEVADAITLMHAKNVAHFDIKPQNILLTDNITPKIADFGLSQVWTKAQGCKNIGFTLMYAPPEQIAKHGNPGLPADSWAFGILMYYTLFGSHPFDYIRKQLPAMDRDQKAERYKTIIAKRYKPLFSRDFEVNHPKLVHIIRMCLRLDPKQRPEFEELVMTLEEVYTALDGSIAVV